MKKLTLLFAIICFAKIGMAQKDSAFSYTKDPMPDFTFYKAPDSTAFTKADLKKHKPVMLMIFSPDCSHCQAQTKEFLAFKEELKDVQIVMTSPLAFKYLKTFYEEYGLDKLPNYTVAYDPKYSMRTLYNVSQFPSMFLYDEKGNLLKAFLGNISSQKILDALK